MSFLPICEIKTMKVSLKTKAIFDCVWFGLMPSTVYEDECHYAGECSYWEHLKMNCRLAIRWINGTQTEGMEAMAKKKTTYVKGM